MNSGGKYKSFRCGVENAAGQPTLARNEQTSVFVVFVTEAVCWTFGAKITNRVRISSS